jgi:hypothetical protein
MYLRTNSSGRLYTSGLDSTLFRSRFTKLNVIADGTNDKYYSASFGDTPFYMIADGCFPWNSPENPLLGKTPTCQLDYSGLGKFAYDADPKVFLERIANTLTYHVLSEENTNKTMISGKAFVNEPYVRVRWPWLILPLLEVIATCGLLAVSITTTRKLPLLKNSAIALLLHGLEGWSEEELTIGSEETMHVLDGVASQMKATFRRDDNGTWKFLRAEG